MNINNILLLIKALFSLDIRKAFDRVQHRKLIDSLYKAGIPDYVIAILANWYAKLTAIVRWNNELSKSFAVRSVSVRAASCLRLYLTYLLMPIQS
jgi:hypothetical protein